MMNWSYQLRWKTPWFLAIKINSFFEILDKKALPAVVVGGPLVDGGVEEGDGEAHLSEQHWTVVELKQ